MDKADRAKAATGVTGAELMGGGATAQPAQGAGLYKRSNGQTVRMSDLNPHHRAAAARKAEAAGDGKLAEELRASGPLE